MTLTTNTIEDGVFINNDASPMNASEDDDHIENIDPLIEPLIDVNELQATIENNENLVRFERRLSTIVSIHSHKQDPTTSSSTSINRCKGIIYALIGSCFFTCAGFIIKQLRVDFFDVLLFRFLLQTIILLAFIIYRKSKIIAGSTNLIILQIVRTIISASGLFLFYLSYRYIPLPDLTTCRYTQVAWTAIIAMIIFRERIRFSTALSIILTLIGVTLVAQPTFLFNSNKSTLNETTTLTINKTSDETNFESDKTYRTYGLCLALVCALSLSCSIVLTKKLFMSKIPQSVTMLHFSFLCLCLMIISHVYNRFILLKYVNKTIFTWQFFVAASATLLQVLSSTLSQRAVKFEHPAIISVVQSSDILFAIMLQNIFAKEKSNAFVLIGSLFVTTSIIVVGVYRFRQDRRKKSAENDTKL